MLHFVKKSTSQSVCTTGSLFIRRSRHLPAVLIFISLLVIWGISARAADRTPPGTINCDAHNGPCTQELAGVKVTLDISPKPVKAMTDLRFHLTLSGKQPMADPYIDLGMPGMKMGPNQVRLQKVSQGVFEGTGIIVRCPSGRRVWKATVNLPGLESVEFIFDVVY